MEEHVMVNDHESDYDSDTVLSMHLEKIFEQAGAQGGNIGSAVGGGGGGGTGGPTGGGQGWGPRPQGANERAMLQQATDAKVRDKKIHEALDIVQKNLKNVEAVARDTKQLALLPQNWCITVSSAANNVEPLHRQ
eukprot:6391957-Pyramimonas_sp.AAC.1